LVPSRGLDSDELGRELAVVRLTGGSTLGLGFEREIEPFATRVVPDEFLLSEGGERVEDVATLDTLAGRLAGRFAGGDVVAIIHVEDGPESQLLRNGLQREELAVAVSNKSECPCPQIRREQKRIYK
jgi:hypothetical protein